MRFLMMVLVALSLSSCTGCTWFKKPTCGVVDKYTSTAAVGIGAFLDCKNTDAIKADLAKATEKLNLCTNDTVTGPLADIFCMPVATYISGLAVKSLPASWECSGGAGSRAVYEAVYKTCTLLPY